MAQFNSHLMHLVEQIINARAKQEQKEVDRLVSAAIDDIVTNKFAPHEPERPLAEVVADEHHRQGAFNMILLPLIDNLSK